MDNNDFFQETSYNDKIELMRKTISQVIAGQDRMIDLILTAILADGHVLIEGVPGIAKTLTARVISKLINADFSRIQFTSDLMPSDVLGTNVFNMSTNSFNFHKGPAFGDIILVDEVLSVGDGAFAAKSAAKMREIINGGAVTILVSHSLEQVRKMCNKVLWLDKGRQVEFTDDVAGCCDRYARFLKSGKP